MQENIRKKMIFDLPEELNIFLEINPLENDSLLTLFSTVKKYLDKIRFNPNEYELIIPLKVILIYYLECMSAPFEQIAEMENLVSTYQQVMQEEYTLRKSFYGMIINTIQRESPFTRRRKEIVIDESYRNIYEIVIRTYTQKNSKSIDNNFSLGGFFDPNQSNKHKAKELIFKAIDHIRLDDSLSLKTKESIINHLNKAALECDNSNANWTEVFGRLKETIFVLGALGSLAGGVAGVAALEQAKEQLEEATKVIEETSINISYKTMSNIFNADNFFRINPNTLLSEERNIKLLGASQDGGLDEEKL